MNVQVVDKETVMMRLTEIHAQIDAAENLLESSISSKVNWEKSYLAKLRDLSEKVEKLEKNETLLPSVCHSIKIEHSKNLKLKLGY